MPLGQVSVVYAHPQSAEQCGEFLDTLGVAVHYTGSNAASALELARDKSGAAIVSEHIASLYSLPVVRRNIENNQSNVTRFVKISADPVKEKNPEKCSIVVDPEEDRPGLLYELLSVFARRNINLCRIESRPSRRGIGSYVFFMDITTNQGWQDALSEISGITQVKPLGCYRRREVPCECPVAKDPQRRPDLCGPSLEELYPPGTHHRYTCGRPVTDRAAPESKGHAGHLQGAPVPWREHPGIGRRSPGFREFRNIVLQAGAHYRHGKLGDESPPAYHGNAPL